MDPVEGKEGHLGEGSLRGQPWLDLDLGDTPAVEPLMGYKDWQITPNSELQNKELGTPVKTIEGAGDGVGTVSLEKTEPRRRRGKGRAADSEVQPGPRARKRRFDISKGAHRKPFPRIPILRWPSKLDPNSKNKRKQPWLTRETEATEWLSLFYDLVVVAVLSVFSETNELSTPAALLTFFSYYVLIAWLWASQTHYDVRYQAEDLFHRQFKAFQIGVFIYIGAASGNWAPGRIQNAASMPDLTSDQQTQHTAANHSFLTVVIAYAISRFMLAFQFAVSESSVSFRAYMGKKTNRRISGHLTSIAVLLFSGLLSIIAIAIPASSKGRAMTKVALFYLGIAVEILGGLAQLSKRLHAYADTAKVAERYGAFSLIILGEGLVGLTRAFNSAITGLSVGNVDTYLQVFLAIGIYYMIWAFMFSRFRREDRIGGRRAYLWEIVHFPLHFGLLLLLAATVNCIINIAFQDGFIKVISQFDVLTDDIRSGKVFGTGDALAIRNYFNKLDLSPPYEQMYEDLLNLTKQSDPDEDWEILNMQYFGQILWATAESYGIEVEGEAIDALEKLYAVDVSNPRNATKSGQRQDTAFDLLVEVMEEPLNTSFSGALWLFPAAGGCLMLIALRNALWYRYDGIAHHIIHGGQVVMGICLALLGFLDVGQKRIRFLDDDGNMNTDISLNPLYNLLSVGLPLMVVFLVFLLLYAGSIAVLWTLHRWRGHVWEYPAEERLLQGDQDRSFLPVEE